MTIVEYDPWAEAEAAGLSPADLDELARVLQWEPWTWVGPVRSRLAIRSWYRTRNGRESYMACLDDGNGDNRFVQTEDLPEFMDLLARWSPIVQADAISTFLDDLRSDDDGEYDTVNRIMTKVLKKWQPYT